MAIDFNGALRAIQVRAQAAANGTTDDVLDPAGGAAQPTIAADRGVAAAADWAQGPAAANIDAVDLDPAELRALDALRENFLADGAMSAPEVGSHQEIRGLLARANQGAGLDLGELRALDNLMQNYLKDGSLSAAEAKSYQEIRSLFMREGAPVQPTPVKDPAGGGGPTAVNKDAWAVGSGAIQGATFRSWGDPHETTGDGLAFDNQLDGTFTKLKSASGDFELQTTQGEHPTSQKWKGAKFNLQAAVKAGDSVVVYDGVKRTLQIDGQAVDVNKLPRALKDGGQVVKTADGIQVITGKGDKVAIHQQDGYIDVSGEVSTQNRKDGEIRGSLGAFDADSDKGNEMLGRTGNAVIKDTNAFLEEWRVKPGQSLFGADPAGGGGPKADPFKQDVEAEFKKRDMTGNGYLSGSEIPADFKAANPTKSPVFLADFLAFRQKQEDAALAADKQAFAARDKNGDFQLDGNEVGDAAKYDKGGNIVANATEVTDTEFLAGRAAERRAARWKDLGGVPADPPGGGGPGGGPVGGGETPQPLAPTERDERQALRDEWLFRKSDRNGNGLLGGKRNMRKFGQFDTDGDGKVSREEFMAGRAKQRIDREFQKADRNGDGVLTGEQTLRQYGAYDANGDGKVTKEEFAAGRLGQIKAAQKQAFQPGVKDKDGDGKIMAWERVVFAEEKDDERKRRELEARNRKK